MNSSYHRPADTWSPLYFLVPLGEGGLAVTFFMFLMFWVPHPDRPVPVFEDMLSAFSTGGLPMKAAILVAVTGIAGFAFLNIKMLIRNLARFSDFRKTDSYTKLANSNGETQLLPAFALSMVAVGMAAPAAMSTVPLTVGVSMIALIMLGTIAGLYAFVAAISAFNSMLHHGTSRESVPTLMVVVTILTVLGIMIMRQEHGLHTTFDAQGGVADNLLLTTTILAVQLVFLALGLLVLRRQKYADAYLRGEGNSAGAYALVCPGVAVSVMLQFWINEGLVRAGLVAKFGVAFWSLTLLAIASQAAMIVLVFVLNHRHFSGRARIQPVPAE